jgi:hypothetical protein
MSRGYRMTCPRCCDVQAAGERHRCESCGCVLTIRAEQVRGLTFNLPAATLPRRVRPRSPVRAARGHGLV